MGKPVANVRLIQSPRYAADLDYVIAQISLMFPGNRS